VLAKAVYKVVETMKEKETAATARRAAKANVLTDVINVHT